MGVVLTVGVVISATQRTYDRLPRLARPSCNIRNKLVLISDRSTCARVEWDHPGTSAGAEKCDLLPVSANIAIHSKVVARLYRS